MTGVQTCAFRSNCLRHLQKTIANIDAIKHKIGWKPTVMLENWIDEVISTNKINEV